MSDLVRPAVEADAPGIHAVHRASWLETYTHLVDAAVIDRRYADAERWHARWRELIARGAVTVAERDGRIVGWAYALPAGADAPRPLELEGIYLLAAAHGSGLGQALLDAVIGDAPAFLWVAEGNTRAEAFYRRNGFVRDGALDEHRVAPDAPTLPAVRMVR